MKKLILISVVFLAFTSANAQEKVQPANGAKITTDTTGTKIENPNMNRTIKMESRFKNNIAKQGAIAPANQNGDTLVPKQKEIQPAEQPK
ncbi:MAG: hypothetical protein ACK4K0_09030 [Flavobacteriales bacterium]